MYLYVDATLLVNNHGRKMKTEDLQQQGAIALVLRVVQQVAQLANYYGASRVYFCLDPQTGSWRKQIDSSYKANREEKLQDPVEKWKKDVIDTAVQQLFPQMLELLLVPAFIGPYIEADDWVAACVACHPTEQAVIITSDKDFWQLVNPNVILFNPQNQYRIVMNEAGRLTQCHADGRQDDIGLTPDQYLLAKCLMGDTSDNLPGLIGIGEGKAKKAIQAGTIRQLISENTGMIQPKRRRKTDPLPPKVHQDANAVVAHNAQMMTLLQSRVIGKVKDMLLEKEQAGLRSPANNFSKLQLWMENHGYANVDLVQQIVSSYTNQWTA